MFITKYMISPNEKKPVIWFAIFFMGFFCLLLSAIPLFSHFSGDSVIKFILENGTGSEVIVLPSKEEAESFIQDPEICSKFFKIGYKIEKWPLGLAVLFSTIYAIGGFVTIRSLFFTLKSKKS